jgi:hypothetical protein
VDQDADRILAMQAIQHTAEISVIRVVPAAANEHTPHTHSPSLVAGTARAGERGAYALMQLAAHVDNSAVVGVS